MPRQSRVRRNAEVGEGLMEQTRRSVDRAGVHYGEFEAHGVERDGDVLTAVPDLTLCTPGGDPVAPLEGKAGSAGSRREVIQATVYEHLAREWHSNTVGYVTPGGTADGLSRRVLEVFEDAEVVECGTLGLEAGLAKYGELRAESPDKLVLLTCSPAQSGSVAKRIVEPFAESERRAEQAFEREIIRETSETRASDAADQHASVQPDVEGGGSGVSPPIAPPPVDPMGPGAESGGQGGVG